MADWKTKGQEHTFTSKCVPDHFLLPSLSSPSPPWDKIDKE